MELTTKDKMKTTKNAMQKVQELLDNFSFLLEKGKDEEFKTCIEREADNHKERFEWAKEVEKDLPDNKFAQMKVQYNYTVYTNLHTLWLLL